MTLRLADIAHARSGDKGSHANVGVIAWTDAGYEFLGKYLTEARLAEYLAPLRPKRVERFSLPGIRAYNFVLHDILSGGASRSLRTDSQGKVLALAVLQMEIPAPPNWQQTARGKETGTGGQGPA
ncbi:MAG: AtuA-related protein [Planctomycetaceae bacterium]